jgi:hypothetical protein
MLLRINGVMHFNLIIIHIHSPNVQNILKNSDRNLSKDFLLMSFRQLLVGEAVRLLPQTLRVLGKVWFAGSALQPVILVTLHRGDKRKMAF